MNQLSSDGRLSVWERLLINRFVGFDPSLYMTAVLKRLADFGFVQRMSGCRKSLTRSGKPNSRTVTNKCVGATEDQEKSRINPTEVTRWNEGKLSWNSTGNKRYLSEEEGNLQSAKTWWVKLKAEIRFRQEATGIRRSEQSWLTLLMVWRIGG